MMGRSQFRGIRPKAKLMGAAPEAKPFTLKAPELSEGVIQAQILNYLAFQRIFAWRQNSVGVYDPIKKIYRKQTGKFYIKGVSDILAVLAPTGRLLAIEVKKVGGYPSKEQKAFLENVNAGGGLGFVARSFKEVEDRLKAEGVVRE
jgi:hypothetical protein